MSDKREQSDAAPDNETQEFNFDWDALSFSSARSASPATDPIDDWEERVGQDTTGYVPNSLTTSFTDLDLGPALVDLRKTPEWADLDSWSDS